VRVLVTGAEGFVGGHLLRTLARDGDHDVVAGSWSGALPDGDAAGSARDVEIVRIDITSDESVHAIVREHRPEWVFHLAAQSSVGRSFDDPAGTWEVNATGTLRLAEALRTAGGARLLVISSAEVYGTVPPEAQPITEEAPLRPATPYGASKGAAELAALQAAAEGGVEVVVARSFNHAGPGQDERFVFPSMARQLVRIRRGAAEPTLWVGNLSVRRDFLDVRDVVGAYLLLMKEAPSGGIYNVCSGEARSLQDMVQRLIELSGTRAKLEVDPARFRPVDIPVLFGDPAKLKRLGWEPEIGLERTLRDLLDEAERTTTAEVG
jgi:GDP-4-dehydro-6-deoxy-D-mannose reductase